MVLASASPRRLQLLEQINITPSTIHPPDINEEPIKDETGRELAARLSKEKAKTVSAIEKEAYVLAADTVVACGRRILPKAETPEVALKCLELLSGRRHHVYGGICLISPAGKIHTRVCDTVVKFKRLSKEDITNYIASGEWKGKAGGYAIQGMASAYIPYTQGSYSNIVGLSLYDTMQLLSGSGFFTIRSDN